MSDKHTDDAARDGDQLRFNYLPAFAGWILEKALDKYSRLMIELSGKRKIPVLKLFSGLTQEQMIELGKGSASEMLRSLSINQAREHIDKSVSEWIANRLKTIDRHAIAAEDIVLISVVRRQVFRLLLGGYTSDTTTFSNIMEEVDRFTAAADIAAFNAYISIHEEKIEGMNQELRTQQNYLAMLIKNAPDAVIVIDEHSIIHLWNPKTEAIFGWKAEEVLGKHLTDTIIPLQYREAHNNGMRHYLKTGEGNVIDRTTEVTAINKRNEELFISLTISETVQSGRRSFIAFLRDVTQQRQTQIELRNKTLLLEQKNRELKHTNEELESFNYAASHDLQEPLRKIQIFTNRIREADIQLPEKIQGYLERINAASARMQDLINDLLLFSQTTSKDELDVTVDLTGLLIESMNTLAHRIEETGARISYGALPVIRGVSFQILQVFINLIGNAIKYHKPGTIPEIWIGAVIVSNKELLDEPGVLQGNYLKISVVDNGIGFDSQFAERLFDLFARLHTTEKYSGTGIGLAISKKIVQNHQGFIRAESDGKTGSSFHIYLPEERIVS